MKRIFLVLLSIAVIYLIFKSESVLKIVFGLSLFLYAMKMLELSFTLMAGGKLEKFLRKTTDKNYKSFLFGFAATSIMQSSGLVSLLAISFVSANLIALGAGLGIIYGCNLGTVTGVWLIAIFGFGFDIAKFAMPFIIFGIFLSFAKSKSINGTGLLILSIGLIFFGIAYMKGGFESVKDLVDLSQYAMPGYRGVIVFSLISVVITALLQSSHATMTLALSALVTGQISYENAVAISIGSNVGSTIMAILGSISASPNGKKLMIAHAIFNITSAILCIIFVWQLIELVEVTSPFLHIAQDNWILKLTLFHTFFNILGVLIFYPTTGLMEKFLNEKVKFKQKREHVSKPRFLSEEALETSEGAKAVLVNENIHLFKNTLSIIAKSLYFSSEDIRSGLNAVEVIKKRSKVKEIDFDKLYDTRFKTLYNDIISFAIRANDDPEDPNARAFVDIRRGAVECAEILKDMRNIEPNFRRYLQSGNEYIRGEYNNLRLQMLHLLRMIFSVESNKDMFALSHELSTELRKFDILSTRKVDELLTKKKITSAMATSLINDSYLLQDIVRNLYKIVKITAIYGRKNPMDFSIFKS